MIQTVENIGEKLVSMLTYDASQPLIFSSGLFLFLFAGFLFFYGFTRRAPMARIVYVILFRSTSITSRAASTSCCSSSLR